jgi:hypothetical protein
VQSQQQQLLQPMNPAKQRKFEAMLAQLEREAGVGQQPRAPERGGRGAGAAAAAQRGLSASGRAAQSSAAAQRRRMVDDAAAALGFGADGAIAAAAQRAREDVRSEDRLRDAVLSGRGGSVVQQLDGRLGVAPAAATAAPAAARGGGARSGSAAAQPGELRQLLRLQQEASRRKRALGGSEGERESQERADDAFLRRE